MPSPLPHPERPERVRDTSSGNQTARARLSHCPLVQRSYTAGHAGSVAVKRLRQTRIAQAGSVALVVAAALALPGCCNVNRITTESLPDATVGQLYSFALTHNCSDKSANEGATWDL